MIEKNAGLIHQIHRRAEDIVYHHDVIKDLQPTHVGRFDAALGQWTAVVNSHRYRAVAIVERCNQALAWYWAAVLRHHPFAHDAQLGAADLHARRPARVTLDPCWDAPLEFLSLPPPKEARPRLTGGISRALEILTLPTLARKYEEA